MNCNLSQYKEFIAWLSGYDISRAIETIAITWINGYLKAKMLKNNNLIVDLVFEYQKYLEMREMLDADI